MKLTLDIRFVGPPTIKRRPVAAFFSLAGLIGMPVGGVFGKSAYLAGHHAAGIVIACLSPLIAIASWWTIWPDSRETFYLDHDIKRVRGN
jgi:hypothetical protein